MTFSGVGQVDGFLLLSFPELHTQIIIQRIEKPKKHAFNFSTLH